MRRVVFVLGPSNWDLFSLNKKTAAKVHTITWFGRHCHPIEVFTFGDLRNQLAQPAISAGKTNLRHRKQPVEQKFWILD
jgi:hypothetical protein